MTAPYIHSGRTVSWYMQQALWAMMPGLLILFLFFGKDILINLAIASISAIAFEALILKIRNLPIIETLKDSSVLVTAWLIAASVPVSLSPLLLILSLFFAVVIAKQLYGGLGHNIFNPAMVAYVVLLISFPLAMSQWPQPALPAFLNYSIDATSRATPLDMWHTQQVITWQSPWLIINLAWMAGGLYLLVRKLIPWQSVCAFLLGLIILTQITLGIQWNPYALLFQLFSGGTMLAAFFIVTDPVTSATTPLGRFIFGLGVSIFTFCIRKAGGFPDGIAFSVLLMNCAVPLLDRYTMPRVFGHKNWWRRH